MNSISGKRAVALGVVVLSVGSFLFIGGAFAQQQIGNGVWICDGAAQAGPCYPDDSDDSTPGGSDGYSDNDYASARPQWADRWGAFAGDGTTAGIVTNKASRVEAESAALAECARRGGNGCEVAMTYYNQCMAVVTGVRGSKLARAVDEKTATRHATSACERDGGGCKLYYSGCSLPERIQ